MKKITTAFALSAVLLTGACAASARSTAATVVAASDATADTLAEVWSAASDARIDECRSQELPTPDERLACLGEFAPENTAKVIAAVQALVVAQLAVKAAAECETFQTCLEKPDWQALAREAREAWAALLPFARAVKANR